MGDKLNKEPANKGFHLKTKMPPAVQNIKKMQKTTKTLLPKMHQNELFPTSLKRITKNKYRKDIKTIENWEK